MSAPIVDHAYRTRYSVALAVLVARATRAESRRAELVRSLRAS